MSLFEIIKKTIASMLDELSLKPIVGEKQPVSERMEEMHLNVVYAY